MASSRAPSTGLRLHPIYRLFFLTIEPIASLTGAYYGAFQPESYLRLTHASSAPAVDANAPLAVRIVLLQLANLYMLFALNEALVLRASSDIRVWRTVLAILLLGDIGHLLSVMGVGSSVYYSFWTWSSMDWGNIGFVYVGASMRIAFLAGRGIYHHSGDRSSR